MKPPFSLSFLWFFFFLGVIGNMASEIIVVKDVALSSKFDAIAFDGHNKSINKIFVSSLIHVSKVLAAPCMHASGTKTSELTLVLVFPSLLLSL